MKITDTIGLVLKKKSQAKILSIAPEQTVYEAIELMAEYDIGALLVLSGNKLVGIFSERDIMKRVVTEGRNPLTTRIAEVMSTDVRSVGPGASSEEAMCLMQTHKVRHLPVCDGRTLVGFLSLRDLLRCHLDEKSGEADAMRAYIQASS